MTTSAPSFDSALAQAVAAFVREQDTTPPAKRDSFASSPLWQAVTATGTELWLDTGDVDAARALWCREFEALTTNNTLLNKEVQKGIYDALVPSAAQTVRAASAGASNDLVVQEIAFILNAVHGLHLVRTFDADVSVELHTALADDAEGSYAYGKRFAEICPDRFIVKIPLTAEGLIAARRLGDDGIRVNFTLGFSARQNVLISRVARPTYVNVFMGRINSFLADNGFGDGVNAGEKATLASQRALRSADLPSRQIGASIRSGQQCLDLLGLDVFTIPTAAAAQVVEANPAPQDLSNHADDDPTVSFGDVSDPAAAGLDVFWQVTEQFHAAATQAAGAETGPAVLEALAAGGCGDVFPTLDAADRQRVGAESKIPKASSWRDRVDAGTASWDGLLTAAALASFTADQKALDDRIRGLLG